MHVARSRPRSHRLEWVAGHDNWRGPCDDLIHRPIHDALAKKDRLDCWRRVMAVTHPVGPHVQVLLGLAKVSARSVPTGSEQNRLPVRPREPAPLRGAHRRHHQLAVHLVEMKELNGWEPTPVVAVVVASRAEPAHAPSPALARFLTGLSRAHCAHLCGGGCWSGWAAGSSAWSLSSTDKAPTREAVDAMPPTDARLRPCPVLAVGR